MRVSREKAAENRELILKEAARLFRERGSLAVGVDTLTEAAGMTHGSLYSHFGSKDNLAAEAIKQGHARNAAKLQALNMHALISAYLSTSHRDSPGTGCFMATLGCDMPQQSKAVRRTFTDIVKFHVARVANLLPNRPKPKRQDDAVVVAAAMVGAMVLARGVDDKDFSDHILSTVRARLQNTFCDGM